MPLVARLFGPEIMGTAGMFAALAAIFTQISAMSYPMAIVLPKSDEEARAITSLSMLVSIVLSSLVAIVLITSLEAVAGILQVEAIKNFLWLIPLLMIFAAIYSVLDQWANRLDLFGAKAISTALTAGLVSLGKLMAGLIAPTPFGLIAVTSATPTLQSISLLSWKRFRSGVKTIPLIDFRTIAKVAWKYRDFAFYRAPEQCLNAITQGLPVILFGAFYGPVFTGYLALAIAALNTPANMVGKAIIDVLYPRLSRKADTGYSLKPTLIRATAGLMLVSALPALALAICAPFLFSLIFGDDWYTSGEYARWLSLWTFLMVSNRAVMAAIPVLSAQRSLLLYTAASTAGRAVVMYLAHIAYNDPIVTVIAFSIASAGFNLFLIVSTIAFKAPQHHYRI